MKEQSYTATVMAALRELAGKSEAGEVTVTDLSHHLFIQTQDGHKKMLNALYELAKNNRAARVRQGVYALTDRPSRPLELRQVMWRILKMRKRVTVEDLMTMAGASEKYALEWLRMLETRQVVRKIGTAPRPSVWLLLATDIDMPVDDSNAVKLRALREKKKKQALADLRAARTLINKALNTMEEETKR